MMPGAVARIPSPSPGRFPTPLVEGDFVFVSTGYGTGSALLRLVKDGDGVRAEEPYFLDGKTLQNHRGGRTLHAGQVYLGHAHKNGFPVCVELKGGKIVSGGEQRGPGSGSAAIVLVGGDLIFRYEAGVVAPIEARPPYSALKDSSTRGATTGPGR